MRMSKLATSLLAAAFPLFAATLHASAQERTPFSEQKIVDCPNQFCSVTFKPAKSADRIEIVNIGCALRSDPSPVLGAALVTKPNGAVVSSMPLLTQDKKQGGVVELVVGQQVFIPVDAKQELLISFRTLGAKFEGALSCSIYGHQVKDRK